MKLYELAEKYYDLFETKKRKEGTFEEETSPKYKLYEEMSNLIHELWNEMDEDSAYEYTVKCLRWLDKSPDNVAWITEAMREFEPDTASKALTEAQYLCIRRDFEKVLYFLCEKLEKKVEIE